MRRSALLLASLLSISTTQFVWTSIVYGETQTEATEPEMNQYQFSAMVNSDNVYVRSGPSENDYPVTKLNMSGMVVVVGNKFDWMKILPPDNTFCLVGKAWIDKRADGTVGRVRDDATNVNVRIGSQLNNMITKVAMQLKAGQDVTILGEQDEYLKIAPPAGTFMYIHKKFVDPVKAVNVVNDNGKLIVKNSDEPLPAGIESKKVSDLPGGAVVTGDKNGKTENPLPLNPSTQPIVKSSDQAAAEAAFDALEAKCDESTKLPLENQPIDEMLASYQKVLTDNLVPSQMQRIAEFRIKGLTSRRDARNAFIDTQKSQAALKEKSKPIVVEGNEIQQKIVDIQVKQFTAVGTLRTSSLPYGGRTLYRLTDPTSSRTVVYINTDDPNIIKYEGMFIGIKGEITEDPIRKIKFIAPKSADQIDPSEIVKGTATGNLVPASLMPSAAAPQQ